MKRLYNQPVEYRSDYCIVPISSRVCHCNTVNSYMNYIQYIIIIYQSNIINYISSLIKSSIGVWGLGLGFGIGSWGWGLGSSIGVCLNSMARLRDVDSRTRSRQGSIAVRASMFRQRGEAGSFQRNLSSLYRMVLATQQHSFASKLTRCQSSERIYFSQTIQEIIMYSEPWYNKCYIRYNKLIRGSVLYSTVVCLCTKYILLRFLPHSFFIILLISHWDLLIQGRKMRSFFYNTSSQLLLRTR